MVKPLFEGRKLLIATKHEKEKAIAPLLEKELGVSCIVPENFDSDQLGTFSGEVERKEDPLTTARRKCELALVNTDYDLVLASEGSFGRHPTLFFAAADDEILLLLDTKNNLEFTARELSTETNFAGKAVTSERELHEFAETVQFPSHGLIVRSAKDEIEDMVKGITDWDRLQEVANHFLKQHGTAFVETDMRAMLNPMRMQVIAQATEKLVEKIKSCCPACQTPGFRIIEGKPGLPCDLCGSPTKSTLTHVYSCQKCDHTEEVLYPKGKKTEEPMFCDFCNP